MAIKTASSGHVTVTGEIPRPYQGLKITDLADQIQHDYEAGKPFDEEIVFEVLNRALDAEKR